MASKSARRVRSAAQLDLSAAVHTARPPSALLDSAAPFPIMPDIFVVSPDNQSSFCAFSSAAAAREVEAPIPSPSAHSFELEDLNANLEYLVKGADEMATRRRQRESRHGEHGADAAQVVPLQDYVHDEDDGQKHDEESRAHSGTPVEPTASSTRPMSPAPGKSLRSKASLVFKRAFSSTSSVSAKTASATPPLPPTSSSFPIPFNKRLPPEPATPPERPVTPTPSAQPTEKQRPTKSRLFSIALFRRQKKQPVEGHNTQQNDPPYQYRPATPEALPKHSSSSSPPSPRRIRRPFSSLALNAFSLRGGTGEQSTVLFPSDTQSSDSGSTKASTCTTDTSGTTSTEVTSVEDDDTASDTSSIITLGCITPLKPFSLREGFSGKRLDSLHFDSAPLFDPASYAFSSSNA